MTDKEKIRAEIERLLKEEACGDEIAVYNNLLSFIDSMKEETVSEIDFEQAIDTYLATYFGGEKEKQDWPFLKKMAIHFANWQKQQDEHTIWKLSSANYDKGYEKGKEEMKQQLMAKAVDATIEEPEPLLWRVLGELEGLFVVENNLHDGDGVKVIIIKED